MIIQKRLKQIRDVIGASVSFEETDNFKFYVDDEGSYIDITHLKSELAIKAHRIHTDCDVEVTFSINGKYPSQRSIIYLLGKALKEAKKDLKSSPLETLNKKKSDLLARVRDVRNEIKEIT